MSEADVIREAIGTDLGEYEIQEPLAALDSLTTRLAEVERERAQALLAVAFYEEDNESLRSQLTQAREALEAIFDRDDSGIDLDVGYIDISLSVEQSRTIRQALATINEGETARERAIRKAGPGYNPFMTARVEDGRDEPATINREGETG